MININFPLTKTFESKEKSNEKQIIFNTAIDNANNPTHEVNIEEGYIYTLYGNNGIGKTTFMNILSLLTDSNQPYYISDNKFYYGFSDSEDSDVERRSDSRFKYFSFIFQDPHIVNMYTLNENMKIVNPDFNYSDDLTAIKDKILELDLPNYTKGFLIEKIDKFIKAKDSTPFYLSGGEKQLMAFIRAMIKPSNILFADEPWASMDEYLKEFIESQLYMFIDDGDIFSSIRNRKANLSPKKVVMIISHPTQKGVHQKEYGRRVEEWTKKIPVTSSPSDNIDEAGILHLDRYISI